MMHHFATFIFSICFSIQIGAQSSALGSPEMGYIDMTTNLWSAMAYSSMLEGGEVEDDRMEVVNLNQIDSILSTSTLPYVIMERYSPNQNAKLPALLFTKNKSGRVRESYLVHQGKDFFLVCNKFIRDPCSCGTDLVLFIPSSGIYKNVERPFSFSMKNNLIRTLRKYFNIQLTPKEYKDTCHIIRTLHSE